MFAQGSFTNSANASPEEIARKRAMIAALMPRFGNAKYVGEGIGQAATGFMIGRQNKKLDTQEAAGRKSAEEMFSGLFSGARSAQPSGPVGISFNPAAASAPPTQAAPRYVDVAGMKLDTGVSDDPWSGQEHIKAGIFAGESGGDYDALFGYQNRPGGKFAGMKPTDMTVGQVLEFQDPQGQYGQWVKGQVGHVATPVGAYQVVGTTLRDAVNAGVIDPNERFDQATQDKVGKWVLSTQGTGAWEGYRGPQQGGGVAQGGSSAPAIPPDQLLAAMSNPWLTPEQRAVLSTIYDQQTQSNDPLRQLELQRAQLEIEKMQNPEGPAPTSTQREYEQARTQGYQGTLLDYKRDLAQAGRSENNVNVNTENPNAPGADEEALRGALGKKEGELWATYLEQGSVSSGTTADMEMLDELIQYAPQGPLSGRLAQAFPGVNSAADAFQSIVKRVAPTLRAPGSGATSDIEYDGMLKSLPQLSSRPEANRAIAAMMKAKAQINIERSRVIQAFQNGEISSVDARRAVQEIDSRSILTPELQSMLQATGGGSSSAPLDFSGMGVAEIGQVNIDSLTPEQMDQLEVRMKELGL